MQTRIGRQREATTCLGSRRDGVFRQERKTIKPDAWPAAEMDQRLHYRPSLGNPVAALPRRVRLKKRSGWTRRKKERKKKGKTYPEPNRDR